MRHADGGVRIAADGDHGLMDHVIMSADEDGGVRIHPR